MKIIDLSMPIENGHFRWPIERKKKGDFASNDLFEVSSISTSCHAFTHMDAPSHMVPNGRSLDALDLNNVVGRAAIADISYIKPNEEITPKHLSACLAHMNRGEIIIFKTCWDKKCDWRTEEYWRDAPWLSAESCEYIHNLSPSAVAFDFPQDYVIRLLLDGEMRPIEEHVSHHILLRNGITLIEYLIGTDALNANHVELIALPINIPNCDGSPSRVIARL